MTGTRARKVLFVIHQIGSGADGGIRSIAEIVRATPAIDRLVVTNRESSVTEMLRAAAPVEMWEMTERAYRDGSPSPLYRLRQALSRLRNNWRTFRAVKRHGITIVHANEQRAFWNSVYGARLAGVPVIYNVRDTSNQQHAGPRWHRALRLCDRFLVLSREMEEAWRADLHPTSEEPGQRDKFAHLYSIVDPERYFPVPEPERQAIRASLGIDPDRPAVVYVGRFDDKKAQLDFIAQALPALRDRAPRAITYFVGDFEPGSDPYAAACLAEVEKHGLQDSVRFAGYSDRVADWYRAADIVALASRREGLPRCMIETLACGSGFVSFAVCSVREIVEGHDCGVAVPLGDYAALADAIAALLADEARLARYRAAGPLLTARLFAPDTNATAYGDLLDRLAAEAAR
ncbi:glycosyltransferase family 4 protein [Sphingomonas canadensis]|uniref:Glycosyltransferase family 4 protein n=1 Tax=Sphingomonas canadensis TaxID=1219257 RepID=A0ABW3H707_9SPHN|nr:glycosyltransferase family 4 protein [Sphingomonas canadensis]MCW3837112.1 glycosyltransferase family 4 protein [Sphingomonas canadensis]